LDERGTFIDQGVSKRRTHILRLLRDGLAQSEIAERLGIAPSSVRTHVNITCRALGVKNYVGAITRAIDLGLLEPVEQGDSRRRYGTGCTICTKCLVSTTTTRRPRKRSNWGSWSRLACLRKLARMMVLGSGVLNGAVVIPIASDEEMCYDFSDRAIAKRHG
jgi:DNA-binding CsgD family transcriptional regulator